MTGTERRRQARQESLSIEIGAAILTQDDQPPVRRQRLNESVDLDAAICEAQTRVFAPSDQEVRRTNRFI
jgi:hypothetical protein